MDSPNALLIGYVLGLYTLLSYSYSQRQTYLTLGSWKRDIGAADVLITGSCTKTEKKKYFLFLFSKANRFPHLGKRLLLPGISYTSQNPFLTDGSGYKMGCLL
jgi:hypothetical protein